MAVRRRDVDRQRDAVFLNGHLDLDATGLLAAIDAARKAAWRRATGATVGDHGAGLRRIPAGEAPAAVSGSGTALPQSRPLRTVRGSFPSIRLKPQPRCARHGRYGSGYDMRFHLWSRPLVRSMPSIV